MPYFSVVIPLYNKEKFIAATINSVLVQTYTNFELIIVNDVSTDNSLFISQSFNDDRIKIISHSENKGLSASRNTGIKNASSEYIAFLDADDLWKPGFLQSIHILIKKYPKAGLFATKYEEVYLNGFVNEIKPFKNIATDSLLDFFSVSLGKLPISFSSLCIHTTVFQEAGYFDEKITYSEDVDFYIRANYNHKLAYYNQSLAQYIIHSTEQMSLAGIKHSVITDFDKYESLTIGRKDIKRFLDFYRYFMAKEYRKIDNMEDYKKMIKGIDKKSLNYKQKMLLMLPGFVLRMVGKVKKALLENGIVVNSYD